MCFVRTIARRCSLDSPFIHLRTSRNFFLKFSLSRSRNITKPSPLPPSEHIFPLSHWLPPASHLFRGGWPYPRRTPTLPITNAGTYPIRLTRACGTTSPSETDTCDMVQATRALHLVGSRTGTVRGAPHHAKSASPPELILLPKEADDDCGRRGGGLANYFLFRGLYLCRTWRLLCIIALLLEFVVVLVVALIMLGVEH